MAEGFIYKMRLALSDLIKPKEKNVDENEQGRMNGQPSSLLNIHSGYKRELEKYDYPPSNYDTYNNLQSKLMNQTLYGNSEKLDKYSDSSYNDCELDEIDFSVEDDFELSEEMRDYVDELLKSYDVVDTSKETQVEQMDRFMNEAFPNGLCEGVLDDFDELEYENIEHLSEQIANNATDGLQDSFDLGTAIMIGSILSMLMNDMDSNDILDMIDERVDNTEGLAELVSAVMEDLGH